MNTETETPEAEQEEAVSRRKRHPESRSLDAILAVLDDLSPRAALRVIRHAADICAEMHSIAGDNP